MKSIEERNRPAIARREDPAKRGRPRATLRRRAVRDLAAAGWTVGEMAALLGVEECIVYRRLAEHQARGAERKIS